MYCKNCGTQLDENAKFCKNCGASIGTGKNYCPKCGKESSPGENFCTYCGTNLSPAKSSGSNQKYIYANTAKSRLAAGFLGIFFGGLGIHNFYLGYTGKAVAQIILSVFSYGIIGSIWGIIEGFLIIAGVINTDADGRPLKD